MNVFKELYSYRELLKTSVKKEIRGKYKASFLGVLWSFLNPLLQILVYVIVFPHLMRGATGDNYVIYVCTGVIPWVFFSTVVSMSVGSVRANGNLVKKVYFPRVILPISTAFSSLFTFMISCVIILAFCLFYGIGISWVIVFVPLIALLQTLFALGIGMALSAMDVYAADLEYIVTFLLNLLFYGSPVVYQLSMFGSDSLLVKLIRLNPITKFLECYRNCFLYQVPPSFSTMLTLLAIALISVIVGYTVFRRLEKGFAEEL